MAARVRRDLAIEVSEEAGAYGEFTVLVDGVPIERGNPFATMFAILPSAEEVVEKVRERLSRSVAPAGASS